MNANIRAEDSCYIAYDNLSSGSQKNIRHPYEQTTCPTLVIPIPEFPLAAATIMIALTLATVVLIMLSRSGKRA